VSLASPIVLVVGLTGGIGSGKSTVSSALSARGARVIDADAIVHELQQPGTEVFAAMVDQLGAGIVDAEGSLDRQAVADLVFGDSSEHRDRLVALNGIVHPAVGAEIGRRLEDAASTDDVVILDVPLMVESGRGGHAGLIVVDCPVDIAISRLIEQRGVRAEDARERVARQVTRDERLAHADFVIDNSGDRYALGPQVDACWEWIESLRSESTP